MSYEGTSYNGRDWMIGCNTSTGEMVVGPYPDQTDGLMATNPPPAAATPSLMI